jgi:hypothetical protein
MVNLLHEWTGTESIKRLRITFPQVVLDEDTVVAKGAITALHEQDNKQLIDCDIWLEEASRGVLLKGSATVQLSAY